MVGASGFGVNIVVRAKVVERACGAQGTGVAPGAEDTFTWEDEGVTKPASDQKSFWLDWAWVSAMAW